MIDLEHSTQELFTREAFPHSEQSDRVSSSFDLMQHLNAVY